MSITAGQPLPESGSEPIDVKFVEGPVGGLTAGLLRTPPRVEVQGQMYERVDDPDTGRFLGCYVHVTRPRVDAHGRPTVTATFTRARCFTCFWKGEEHVSPALAKIEADQHRCPQPKPKVQRTGWRKWLLG